MHDSLHITIQTRDTKLITHALLDHNGIKVTLYIPLIEDSTTTTALYIPNTEQKRPTRFQFPIPQPLLIRLAEEVRGATKNTTSSLHTELTKLISTLNTPTNSISSPRKNYTRSYKNTNT